ncbi:MAG: hydrolase 1, exosortase A system-associated [Sphingorhabdus sp.]
MRRMINFDCEGAKLAGTLDEGVQPTGLLIVSGGNEIRSGAHAGQAAMAAHFAALGYPVFRYDRRGIGDSEGDNGSFESSSADIASAVSAFRNEAAHMQRLVAFGNCDAATALALFHKNFSIDALILANPWVIENATTEASSPPTSAAVRARYWNRLKNPRSLIDLLTGKINLRKLAGGLVKATQSDRLSGLSEQLASTLSNSAQPITILIADRDTTALAFMVAWKSDLFAKVRTRREIALHSSATASHSFADMQAKAWLLRQIESVLSAD